MSNFEYIMRLNLFAGRSFNDITQYPVFPWVLKDYSSDTIDLNDESVYRDLSKPIGALNEDRLQCLLERFRDMDGFSENFRFLYGSFYSSPGIVLHFLVRQEPFTSMAIDLQGGRFDCPDRLFFNIESSWACCQTNSGDFKELIPELFFSPEILVNSNNFPLGELQDGKGRVNDVVLPKWAKGSPHEFIRIQREALESEYVSKNLHLWIDLIFGYKQNGEEAIKANNLFHRLSYEGAVDLDRIEDPVERKGAEAHIQNFGQVPSQLLVKTKHAKRSLPTEAWTPLTSNPERLQNLKAYVPGKQYGLNGERGAVMAMGLHGEVCRVVYEDMTLGIYHLSPQDKDGFPFSFKQKELNELPTRGYKVMGGRSSFGFISKASKSSEEDRDDPIVLANGFWDRQMKICKAEGKGKKRLALLDSTTGGHSGEISCLANKGSFVVTGGVDSTVRVFVYDNDLLAEALGDSYVKLHALEKKGGLANIHVLFGHTGVVTCLDLCNLSDVLISADDQGIVCVHALRRGAFIRLIDVGKGTKMLKVSESGEFVVHNWSSNSDEGSLAVWSVNGVLLREVKLGAAGQEGGGAASAGDSAPNRVNCMELCSAGRYIVAGFEDGTVCFFAMSDLTVTRIVEMMGPINCIMFTPHDQSVDQYIIVGLKGGSLAVIADPKHRLRCLDDALQALPWFE